MRFTPLWIASGSYQASVDRRLIAALWPGGGVNGGAVTPGASGMQVQAAPGSAAVPASNGTGSVLCVWDAPEVVTLDPSLPSGTNRIDLVCVQANANDMDGGTVEGFSIIKVAGTGGATPTPPAVPAGAVALAQVLVNGGDASVIAARITDRRGAPLAPTPAIAGRMYATTSTSLPQAGTATPLNNMALDFLRGGMTFVSNQLAVPVSGVYQINMQAVFNGNAGTAAPVGYYNLWLRRNGAQTRQVSGYVFSAGPVPSFGGADLFNLNAGDLLGLTAATNASGGWAAAIGQNTYLSAALVATP